MPGSEREPRQSPIHHIQMREHHTEHFKVCPWSVALSDRRVSQWLLAYGMVEKWGKWPPGRDDPQLVEAFMVIANEHARDLK